MYLHPVLHLSIRKVTHVQTQSLFAFSFTLHKISDYNFTFDLILEYIDARSKTYQAKVDETMQSNSHYVNLTASVDNLHKSGAAILNDNTLPATFEAIANIEAHPTPDTVNGIDLKRLYKLMANLMAGYPTEELEDGPTKDFLYKCYAVREFH